MKEIPLTQGKVALVDDADFDWLNQWKWYASDEADIGMHSMQCVVQMASRLSC